MYISQSLKYGSVNMTAFCSLFFFASYFTFMRAIYNELFQTSIGLAFVLHAEFTWHNISILKTGVM